MRETFRPSPLVVFNFAICGAALLVALVWAMMLGKGWVAKLILNPAFIVCLVLAGFLIALSLFYAYVRKDAFLARLLLALAIMQCAVFAGVSLTYLVPSARFPMMDQVFARFDSLLGFDFPAFVAWAHAHDWVRDYAAAVYNYVTVSIAFVAMAYLAATRRIEEFEKLVSFIVLSAMMTIFVGMMLPAGSTFAYYQVPQAVEDALGTLTGAGYNVYYGRVRAGDLTVLEEGFRGMIAFPSFHTVLGLMSVLYLRSNPWLMAPIAVLAALMIATTPLIGGHFLADILGGIAVSLVCYRLVERLAREPEPTLAYAAS